MTSAMAAGVAEHLWEIEDNVKLLDYGRDNDDTKRLLEDVGGRTNQTRRKI